MCRAQEGVQQPQIVSDAAQQRMDRIAVGALQKALPEHHVPVHPHRRAVGAA